MAQLLKLAEMDGFLRGIVSSKLMKGYDKSSHDNLDWQEFKAKGGARANWPKQKIRFK